MFETVKAQEVTKQAELKAKEAESQAQAQQAMVVRAGGGKAVATACGRRGDQPQPPRQRLLERRA